MKKNNTPKNKKRRHFANFGRGLTLGTVAIVGSASTMIFASACSTLGPIFEEMSSKVNKAQESDKLVVVSKSNEPCATEQFTCHFYNSKGSEVTATPKWKWEAKSTLPSYLDINLSNTGLLTAKLNTIPTSYPTDLYQIDVWVQDEKESIPEEKITKSTIDLSIKQISGGTVNGLGNLDVTAQNEQGVSSDYTCELKTADGDVVKDDITWELQDSSLFDDYGEAHFEGNKLIITANKYKDSIDITSGVSITIHAKSNSTGVYTSEKVIQITIIGDKIPVTSIVSANAQQMTARAKTPSNIGPELSCVFKNANGFVISGLEPIYSYEDLPLGISGSVTDDNKIDLNANESRVSEDGASFTFKVTATAKNHTTVTTKTPETINLTVNRALTDNSITYNNKTYSLADNLNLNELCWESNTANDLTQIQVTKYDGQKLTIPYTDKDLITDVTVVTYDSANETTIDNNFLSCCSNLATITLPDSL